MNTNTTVKAYGKRDWIAGAAVLAIGLLGVLVWQLSGPASAPAVEKVRAFDVVDASVMCREAIRRTSRDPEKADVPMVFGHQTEGEIKFFWGPQNKLVRLQNGLGLEVGVSATCIADVQKRAITSLMVNGVKLK